MDQIQNTFWYQSTFRALRDYFFLWLWWFIVSLVSFQYVHWAKRKRESFGGFSDNSFFHILRQQIFLPFLNQPTYMNIGQENLCQEYSFFAWISNNMMITGTSPMQSKHERRAWHILRTPKVIFSKRVHKIIRLSKRE